MQVLGEWYVLLGEVARHLRAEPGRPVGPVWGWGVRSYRTSGTVSRETIDVGPLGRASYRT